MLDGKIDLGRISCEDQVMTDAWDAGTRLLLRDSQSCTHSSPDNLEFQMT